MPSFQLSRDIEIKADPATVHGLLNDFRNWRNWSPWEDVDPDLVREYSGAESGPGAHYAWRGNKKAGTGPMEIIESTPERVVIDLVFLEPFKATNEAVFTLAPSGTGTRVDWTMTGERNLLFTIAGKLFVDRAVGKDFEKGLAALKAQAESAPTRPDDNDRKDQA